QNNSINTSSQARKHNLLKHPHASAVQVFKERSPIQAKPRIIRTRKGWSSLFREKKCPKTEELGAQRSQ
ncbi:MAG: hypothetical protein JSU95_11540, partial [Betaproteobacteria bacterium]